jgi:hypothetical protein
MNVKGAALAAGIFLCSLLLCSCYREPHRGSYCTSRPAEDKVAGVYGLGDDSVFHKKGFLGSWRKAFLELHTDGNFVMQDMPGWECANSSTFCMGEIWSGTGTWGVREAVDRRGRFFRVWLDFDKLNG